MRHLLWDASALVKRYYMETGQDAVNALFQPALAFDHIVTPWGYAEVYAILLRKRNSGILGETSFARAAAQLQTEVLGNPGFRLLSISDAMIFGSLSLMAAHNLNAADAAILFACLQFQQGLPADDHCFLAAADKRLARASEAEGLNPLNPELIAAPDVAMLLASQ